MSWKNRFNVLIRVYSAINFISGRNRFRYLTQDIVPPGQFKTCNDTKKHWFLKRFKLGSRSTEPCPGCTERCQNWYRTNVNISGLITLTDWLSHSGQMTGCLVNLLFCHLVVFFNYGRHFHVSVNFPFVNISWSLTQDVSITSWTSEFHITTLVYVFSLQ
jgi:hypothetical protein